jgi:hypothetical protein
MVALALTLLLAAPRAVVMPVAPSEAISSRRAESLTDALAAELRRQGLAAFTYRDLALTLSPEEQKRAVECRTDLCLAEAAAAAGADRMIVGEVAWDGQGVRFHLRALEVRPVRLVAVVDRRFKGGTPGDVLDALPAAVKELLTSGPSAEAVAAPRPAYYGAAATTAARTAPPKDTFVLHYHRKDGRYGVSLVSWESLDGPQDLRRPVPGSVPGTAVPRDPDGKDAFGVYWWLPVFKFRNGKVNFLVRTPGGFDECGPRVGLDRPAQLWVLADGNEAWLEVPGCELRPRLEQAEPAPVVVPALAPAAASKPTPAPAEDTFVLHYHRRDGRYGALGLYAWETFNTGTDLRKPVPGIGSLDRLPTLDPDGTDAFGVYWRLPASRFRNGRVNFRVWTSGTWDECRPWSQYPTTSLFWILSDGREAWLNAPECELYPSLEQAESAHGR